MNVRYAVDFDEIRGKGEVYTKIQKLIESRAIKTSRLKTGTDDKGKGKGKRKATAIEPPHSINPWKFILLEMMMYPRGQARVDLSLEEAQGFLFEIYKKSLRGTDLTVYTGVEWLDPIYLFNYTVHTLPNIPSPPDLPPGHFTLEGDLRLSGVDVEATFHMILHPDIHDLLASKNMADLRKMDWPQIETMIRATRSHAVNFVIVQPITRFEHYYNYTGAISCKRSMDNIFHLINNGLACIAAMHNVINPSKAMGSTAAKRAVFYFHAVYSQCMQVQTYFTASVNQNTDEVSNPGFFQKLVMMRADAVYYIAIALFVQGRMMDACFFMNEAYKLFKAAYCDNGDFKPQMRRIYRDAEIIYKTCPTYHYLVADMKKEAESHGLISARYIK